jgi:hypothetical protein
MKATNFRSIILENCADLNLIEGRDRHTHNVYTDQKRIIAQTIISSFRAQNSDFWDTPQGNLDKSFLAFYKTLRGHISIDIHHVANILLDCKVSHITSHCSWEYQNLKASTQFSPAPYTRQTDFSSKPLYLCSENGRFEPRTYRLPWVEGYEFLLNLYRLVLTWQPSPIKSLST